MKEKDVIMSVIGFDKSCNLEVDGKIYTGGVTRSVMPPVYGKVEEECINNTLDIEMFDHFNWELFFRLRSVKSSLWGK
jgi:hypothetical protein